jgi:hypothetical protein
MPLPLPPAEPPRQTDLAAVAPLFAVAVRHTLHDVEAKGWHPIVYEALRTDERQRWLYGFGRDWDDADPRGRVTQAPTGDQSWHRYGLAVDIIDPGIGWDDTSRFWAELADSAETYGLAAGYRRWLRPDPPHLQFGRCRRTPSAKSAVLFVQGGLPAVWRAVGAV